MSVFTRNNGTLNVKNYNMKFDNCDQTDPNMLAWWVCRLINVYGEDENSTEIRQLINIVESINNIFELKNLKLFYPEDKRVSDLYDKLTFYDEETVEPLKLENEKLKEKLKVKEETLELIKDVIDSDDILSNEDGNLYSEMKIDLSNF